MSRHIEPRPSPCLLHSLLPINLLRKLRHKIKQRSIPHLPQHSKRSIAQRILRSRLPHRRQRSSAKCSSIQRPLRVQMLLAPVVRQQISYERMPRPPQQTFALASVIADFVSQLRIAQCRQRIRRNKLALPRRPPLPKSANPALPLPWCSRRLINQSAEHPLPVSLRSSERLLQINFFSLLTRERHQLPVLPHINSRDARRLPVPSLNQPRCSRVLRFSGHRLQRIRTVLFLLAFVGRIRQLFPLCLTGCLRRVALLLTLPRHAVLSPRTLASEHCDCAHYRDKAPGPPTPPSIRKSHSSNVLSANSAASPVNSCARGLP